MRTSATHYVRAKTSTHPESHHYENDESEVWKHHQLQRHFQDKGNWWTFAKKKEVRQWALTLLTGLCCGLIAVIVTYTTKEISRYKFQVFKLLIERERIGEIHTGFAFLFFYSFNTVCAFIAVFATAVEPLSSGSGIPEIKCFLNGLDIPKIVSLKTLVCKAIGIVFACASGLPLGKEGPMVHIGSVLAAIISQGLSFPGSSSGEFRKYQDFRNDREKRDFVACGAAAGVAAAFGAPIGGVLFSLEEGASFWSTKLTWRCFFCAMMTVSTVFAISTIDIAFGHSDMTAMFSFGEFFSYEGGEFNYSIWELSIFCVIGAAGGLVGAWFIDTNSRISKYREAKNNANLTSISFPIVNSHTKQHNQSSKSSYSDTEAEDTQPILANPNRNNPEDTPRGYRRSSSPEIAHDADSLYTNSPESAKRTSLHTTGDSGTIQDPSAIKSASFTTFRSRLFGVIFVSSLMSTVSFVIPLLWSTCTRRPTSTDHWSDQEKLLATQLAPLYCPPQTHYNELASLYLTDSDTAIKQLFHFREVGDKEDSTFSSAALFFFFVPYICLACLTNGISVPSGLFVPSLLSGAALGRLFGHLLHRFDHARGTFADSGTYALMGAAAVTAGISRMTISLTVMILEATGDMQYVLPLMLTVMASRFVGNIFNRGIYDMYIERRHLNYLDEDESISQLVELHDLSVSEIMTRRPICLRPVVIVGELFDMLRSVSHNSFPVVDDKSHDALIGTVSRKVLCTLLKHRAFAPISAIAHFYRDAALQGNSESKDSRDSNSKDDDGEGKYSVRGILQRGDVSKYIRSMSPIVNWDTLECIYPDYPDARSLHLSENERLSLLDLRPYMDCAPFTISENASIQRTYRMFRTLGLRHLCVTNTSNQVLGIVTRANLVPSHLISSSLSPRQQRRKRKQSDYLHPTINLDFHHEHL